MRNVKTTARRGSPPAPLPAPKARSERNTLSRANACRMRGDPIMLPSADDNVAANTPAVISPGQRAISAITRLSPVSAVCGRTAASRSRQAQVDDSRDQHRCQRTARNRAPRIPQIARHIRPRHDARDGGEEQGEHGEEVLTFA